MSAVLEVAVPEQALECTRPRRLEALVSGAGPSLPELPGDWPASGRHVDRLYLGSEFCERLIPPLDLLRRVVNWAGAHGVALTLATPIVSDGGLRLLRRVLRHLPAGSEVVVNDWGVLHLLRRDHPNLRPVAGRGICKAIKDPRLPSATWARLYPPSFGSTRHAAMLARRGFVGVQLDIAPFARPRDLHVPGLPVAVNVGHGYVTKGRTCRFGSFGLAPGRKFAPGHAGRFECHDDVA
ncbi:MAG: hypothetical protein R3298_13445, partial [Gammaproteobacteria bacterium]|nr:hypothetical protein [Gammaproteobacteria bacterium]